MADNSIIKRFYKACCPDFLKRLIDAETYRIATFVKNSALEMPMPSRVLDAGAGECAYKDFFKGHHYCAVDATWGDAKWNYSNLNVIANLSDLPFADNQFDAAICTQVLEHVCAPQAVVNELFRVLKADGGTLYISAPQGWGVHQAPHDYFRYTNYGIAHLCRLAGFREALIEPSCGYFGYLADRLTVLPKTLFWQIENLALRIVLFPMELVSYLVFVIVLPILLNAIDFLDTKRSYTLNYYVKARK